jgi:opine dehydrogenase
MPMRALGLAAGVPTPHIDAVITLAQILADTDFAASERTLDRMGLAGTDAAGIRRTVAEGPR